MSKKLFNVYSKKEVFQAYVVADDYNEACKAFEDWLREHDYGFTGDREVKSIEVLASTSTMTLDGSDGLLILPEKGGEQ